jgi:hypothetical protein
MVPGLRLLLPLPRPPCGSVFVSPLAQFSMAPDRRGRIAEYIEMELEAR